MASRGCASITPPPTWLIKFWKLIQICVYLRKSASKIMHTFEPGDDLIFQLESGFGLLRVLAVEGEGSSTVWHLLAYDEFFPDVESAELALAGEAALPVRQAHMALTNRAFERTPAARLGNRPVTADELVAYNAWLNSERAVSDRSALLMLGIR
jgi:hypothetical protein